MSSPSGPWFNPKVSSLQQGILYTLSYADIFDYPLTLMQLQRYLVGMAASMDDVAEVVDGSKWAQHHLAKQGEYYMLPGRESLAALREHRAGIAQRMWKRARHYASAISRMPFVRMVALTGALCSGNVEVDDDYDYLIVAEQGHLWLTRSLIVQLVVKPAMQHGEEVCPNYIITERALALDESEHNLYQAHELAQMVPMYGLPIYNQLRATNAWAHRFLPNAVGAPQITNALPAMKASTHQLSERALQHIAG